MQLNVTLPVGSLANVTIPTPVLNPQQLVITESGHTVWANSTFVPAAAAIIAASSATAPDGTVQITFTALAGQFAFLAAATNQTLNQGV
jgi:hypothetical protein